MGLFSWCDASAEYLADRSSSWAVDASAAEFGAALEDAGKAYAWLARQFDPERIAFVGDSAGGGLAFATLLKLRDEARALPVARSYSTRPYRPKTWASACLWGWTGSPVGDTSQ